MAAQGATALFVPTNNGLPPAKAHAEIVAQARNADIARAVENSLWVIRADVAGRTGELVSYGSSGIVGRSGFVLGAAQRLEAGLVVADINTAPRQPRPGWDASRNPAVASEYAQLVARAFAITEHSTDVTKSV
jgi:predicted amidohydrolase